jgi:hypothetical protein
MKILADKETIAMLLTASHDLHLQRLDAREDDTVQRIDLWLNETMDDLHDNMEQARNRQQIVEINHFIVTHRQHGTAVAQEALSVIEAMTAFLDIEPSISDSTHVGAVNEGEVEDTDDAEAEEDSEVGVDNLADEEKRLESREDENSNELEEREIDDDDEEWSPS